MTETVADRVMDECIRISDLPAMARPPEITALVNEYRSQGYTKTIIVEEIARITAARQEEQLASEGGELIEQLNQEYFVMMSDSKVKIGSLQKRELNGHEVQSLSMISRADFGLIMANRVVAGTTADQVWLGHPERQEYRGIITHPDRPREYQGKLNMWAGFGVKPKKMSVKLFIKHLNKMFDNDQKQVNYILDWLAWGIQNPHLPIGTAIVLIGDQGTGKGIIGNCIRSIYASHGVSIKTQKDLVGSFNSHLAAACFAFVDEALFSGDKRVADAVKGLITEPTIGIEAKFQDRIEVDNMLNLFCASNHDHAMQVEFSDRRYAIFGVTGEMPPKGDKYWKELGKFTNSKEGKAAILYYLKMRDVSQFNPERDRPITEFYVNQKVASLNDDWLWWRLVCERETLNVTKGVFHYPEFIPLANGGQSVTKLAIYNAYCAWAAEQRFSKIVPASVFWKNAQRWIPKDLFRRSGNKGSQVRMVDLPDYPDLDQILMDYLWGRKPKW